jgi:hypothetical protein
LVRGDETDGGPETNDTTNKILHKKLRESGKTSRRYIKKRISGKRQNSRYELPIERRSTTAAAARLCIDKMNSRDNQKSIAIDIINDDNDTIYTR